MKKKLSSLLILCCAIVTYAQTINDNWQFSNRSIDFNSNPPTVTTAGVAGQFGKTSISDAFGNLLFYTDGVNVWNKNHSVMTNGANYAFGTIFQNYEYNDKLASVQIAQNPANPSEYYIFTALKNAIGNGISSVAQYFYSVVEFNSQAPNGRLKVVNPNLDDFNYYVQTLYSKSITFTGPNVNFSTSGTSAMIALAQKGDDSGLWLILRFDESLYTYDINNITGFNTNVVSSFLLGEYYTNIEDHYEYFDMKFNQSQDFLYAIRQVNFGNNPSLEPSSKIYKINFNKNNGSFFGTIAEKSTGYPSVCLRLEISDNGQYLYYVRRPDTPPVEGYENDGVYVQSLTNFSQAPRRLNVVGASSSQGYNFIDIQKDKNNEILLMQGGTNNAMIYKINNQDSYSNSIIDQYFSLNGITVPTNYYTYHLPRLIIDVHNDCPSVLNITNNVTSGMQLTKQAAQTINATNSISSGAIVTYRAGNEVVLKPNFVALSGSQFSAYIFDCSGAYYGRYITENMEEIKNSQVEEKIVVYPNPNKGIFKVRVPQLATGQLEVYDLRGKQVYFKNFKELQASDIDVNLESYPNGVYLIRVNLEQGSFTEKIIKN
uniref:T9SS type A sorting domain-containing protein n=1 Tax=Flavobacterium sp. TaxID=239 RepID=UPI00404A808C